MNDNVDIDGNTGIVDAVKYCAWKEHVLILVNMTAVYEILSDVRTTIKQCDASVLNFPAPGHLDDEAAII